MKFPRLSRKTWIAIGLVVVLGVLVFMSRTREGMGTTTIEPLVRDGTLKNYTACVDNSTLQQIARASPQPGDDGPLNKTRYGLCSVYYVNPMYVGGQSSSVDDRKPIYISSVTQPTPQPSPVVQPTPQPSTPPSSATYSASCSKCSVINNQITCACDVIPK